MTATSPTSTATLLGLVGLDLIRTGAAEPPPAARLLGLDLLVVEPGRTVFGFHPTDGFGNGSGATHGGILATVADFAVATAVMTEVPVDADVRTTNLALTYVSGLRSGEDATCEGRLVHLGRTLAHAEAVMTTEDGRVVLTATATCHVRRRDQPASGGTG